MKSKKTFTMGQIVPVVLLVAATVFVMTTLFYQSFTMNALKGEYVSGSYQTKLKKVEKIIRENYYGEIDEEKLSDGILAGLSFGTRDLYGDYYDAEETAQIMAGTSGENIGIGIRVIEGKDGRPLITEVYAGAPAESAGIRAGDIIAAVNKEDCADLGYYIALDRMLGKEGTGMELTLYRDGNAENEVKVSVSREHYKKQSVFSQMINGNIGYIRISDFNTATVADFDLALKDLQNKGAVGIVFDLRGNPGGELSSICNILDILLPEGVITTIRYKTGAPYLYHSKAGELELPAAVLVNHQTASAAELFAAAMQDYQKAVIVGEQTYGKGCMQEIIPIGDGSSIRVTTAMFDPPYNKNFNEVGVAPDLLVKQTEEEKAAGSALPLEQDSQLQAAVSAILSR